jgi:hypothetical protein
VTLSPTEYPKFTKVTNAHADLVQLVPPAFYQRPKEKFTKELKKTFFKQARADERTQEALSREADLQQKLFD